MDQTTSVILAVSTPKYKQVRVEASDGFIYMADLSPLSAVYCFPKNEKEWNQVYIDSDGYALIWKNRFEVHMDQITGLAVKKEPSSQNRQNQSNLEVSM